MKKKEVQMEECDCISKVAENIKAKITADQTEKQKGYKMLNGNWEHHSWYPKVRLYSNYIIESTFEKKDGSTSKPRKDHVSIFYSYCPFCGKPFPK